MAQGFSNNINNNNNIIFFNGIEFMHHGHKRNYALFESLFKRGGLLQVKKRSEEDEEEDEVIFDLGPWYYPDAEEFYIYETKSKKIMGPDSALEAAKSLCEPWKFNDYFCPLPPQLESLYRRLKERFVPNNATLYEAMKKQATKRNHLSKVIDKDAIFEVKSVIFDSYTY